MSGWRFESVGRSMWPLLRPGDVAQVEPLDRPPRPGDVLVYVDPAARLVAHRLIEICPDGRLRLRGDFAFTAEAPIEARRIVGRLTSVDRPGRGRVSLEGALGRLLAAALPPLERWAPGVLTQLRRSVIGAIQVADWWWTVGPLRRLRRRGGGPAAVDVSPARDIDQAALEAHLRRTGRDPANYRASPDLRAICARLANDSGLIVGSMFVIPESAGINRNLWSIGNLYVEHRWRGLGIGRRLLERAVVFAQDAGARELHAEVPPENTRARSLMRSFGFKPNGGDVSRLALVLSAPQSPHIVPAR